MRVALLFFYADRVPAAGSRSEPQSAGRTRLLSRLRKQIPGLEESVSTGFPELRLYVRQSLTNSTFTLFPEYGIVNFSNPNGFVFGGPEVPDAEKISDPASKSAR